MPRLRSQSEILSEFRSLLRDPSGDNERWHDNEYYSAINIALSQWASRVQVPNLYSFSIVSGTYEYTLPNYVDTSNMDVLSKKTIWGLPEADDVDQPVVYTSMPAWTVEPDGSGGQTLVLKRGTTDTTGHVIWYGRNGRLPEALPKLSGDVADDDESIELDRVLTSIGRTGFVKVNREFMAYQDFSDDGSNTTLTITVRGLEGSTAAAHSEEDEVDFCIAVPDERLDEVLYHQVAYLLHTMFLANGAPKSTEIHERVIGLHRDEVKNFWRGWVPIRGPKLILSRQTMGEITE